MQDTNLNIIPKGIPDTVNVSQFDVGRELKFTLYDDTQIYTIPAGATVEVGGRKPDGNIFDYEATISQDRHYVTIATTEQMTAVAGDNLCQLRINVSGVTIATVNFTMRVQERPDVGDISSVSEIPVIISLAREEQYNAEAWAKGTKNGIAVTSEDTQYNNHAKYWAEQAAQSAQEFAGGVIYKGSVAFANIPTSGMKHGWMYNVTDDFTTDSRFSEGAGIFCLAGQNIVWNNDISKWDLAARGGVSSFNGRYGAITPTNGDYSAAQITANETIGGVVKTNVGDAISTLNSVKVDKHQTGGVDDRLMTAAEGTKLEGIEAQANKTVVDSALSDSSTNPVQNKVIKSALDGKQPKTLDTPITVEGVVQTTVEGALGAINNKSSGGGGGTPYASNPEMDGVASPGTTSDYSRGDHVHPSDTSRVAKAGDTMTGALTVQGNITSNGDIIDGSNNKLSDKSENLCVLKTVSSSNWSSVVDSNGYYTNVITTTETFKVSHIPDVYLRGSTNDTKATAAEEAAWSLIGAVSLDDADGYTFTFKAKTKPTTTFYVAIKGERA